MWCSKSQKWEACSPLLTSLTFYIQPTINLTVWLSWICQIHLLFSIPQLIVPHTICFCLSEYSHRPPAGLSIPSFCSPQSTLRGLSRVQNSCYFSDKHLSRYASFPLWRPCFSVQSRRPCMIWSLFISPATTLMSSASNSGLQKTTHLFLKVDISFVSLCACFLCLNHLTFPITLDSFLNFESQLKLHFL